MADALTPTRVTEDGKCLAKCRKCGAWKEVQPETAAADLFFETLKGHFFCCGLRQTASLVKEKDTTDFH